MSLFTAYTSSPIGLLKIQATEENIVVIKFVTAEEEEANANLLTEKCAIQLAEYFEGRRKNFDLPLDQKGSQFQKKVWNLLYQIPFGKIISYQVLSKQYGDPKAIRAIASANGKNNLPIIIPCHRVIGSDHSLTGYAGGLWRKQWLLEHEAKCHSGLQLLFN